MCKAKRYKNIPNTRIDKCLKNELLFINLYLKKPYKIIASCCGHDRYNRTVIIQGGKNICFEIVSGKHIPRKRNFYKRDKQGYYYIPEINKEVNPNEI